MLLCTSQIFIAAVLVPQFVNFIASILVSLQMLSWGPPDNGERHEQPILAVKNAQEQIW